MYLLIVQLFEFQSDFSL